MKLVVVAIGYAVFVIKCNNKNVRDSIIITIRFSDLFLFTLRLQAQNHCRSCSIHPHRPFSRTFCVWHCARPDTTEALIREEITKI